MSRKPFRLPFNRPTGETPAAEPNRLQEENRQLKRAVEELAILNDLARAIGASLDSQDIIHKIVDRSMRAVLAEQTVVTLVDRHEDRTMKTLVRAMTSSAEHPKFHLNESLLGWMHLYKKPLLCMNPGEDERFKRAIQSALEEVLPVADGVLTPPWAPEDDESFELFGYSMADTRQFAGTSLMRRLKVIGLS